MPTNYIGTLRITNPDTIRKYIFNGELTKLEEKGYEYQPGCGRFMKESCQCHKCKTLFRQARIIAMFIKRHSEITL